MSMRTLSQLLRVQHWTKNLLLFFPAFFGQALLDLPWQNLILTVIAFCTASSACYIFNDLIDAPFDQLHDEKKQRPIASGQIRKEVAIGLIFTLVGASLVISHFINNLLLIVIGGYIIQNLLYSLWLKNFAILDITIISFGFLLRIYAGGLVALIEISNWMYIMTFLLAMFLAIIKRKNDVVILQDKNLVVRQSVKGYSLRFIDLTSVLLGSAIIVAYLMYTVSPEVTTRIGSKHVYITSVFVLLGILRYLQLSLVQKTSVDPTKLFLTDNPLRLVVFGWLIAFAFLLYL